MAKTKESIAPLENLGGISRAEQAYRAIREKILHGVLFLGDPVHRRELAEELGMSVLPVGEALKRLEFEGLIENMPRVGTRVRIPSLAELRGLFLVREALEAQAARLFAERAGPRDKREVRQLAADLDKRYDQLSLREEIGARDFAAIRDQHIGFHTRVAELAGSAYLLRAIEQNLLLRVLYDQIFGMRGMPPAWHTTLAEALAHGDAEAADRTLRQHIRLRQDELFERLEALLTVDRAKVAEFARARGALRREN